MTMRDVRPAVVLLAVAFGGCGGHHRAGDTERTTARLSATVPSAGSTQRLGPVGVSPAAHQRLPALRRCRLSAEAAKGGLLNATVGGGATCRTARVVLLKVSHWKGRTCWRSCPAGVLMARGFSCTTHKIGEADWSVDCWEG